MRLPLLLQASNRLETGPVVMLAKGNWEIESNLVDTEARLLLGSDLLVCKDELKFTITDDTRCCVSIVNPGSEPYITIYAHKL